MYCSSFRLDNYEFTMSTIPVFTSPAGKLEIMNACQAIMDKWQVPFEELTVFTSFGETYIIASGPENALPVVLIHA